MSDASKPYNPHTNRGRKRTDADAPSKRSGQMREVQRAHRERKKAYVVGLEERVKELEALFGSGTTPTSTAQPASLVAGHTGARNEYIRGLESMAASLKDENRNLRLKLATFDVHFGLEGGNGGQDEYEGLDDVLGLGSGDGGVAGGGWGVCVDPGCTAERMKVLALEGRILLLENDLDKSRKECMELKKRLGSEGPAGMDTTNSTLSLGMFDELDMYLEKLDGTEGYEDTNIPPPPEVETSRLALKALPSLRNSGATVDRLAQMVQMAHANMQTCRKPRNPQLLKLLLFEMYKTYNALLDECSIIDRMKIVEITALFNIRNRISQFKYTGIFLEMLQSNNMIPTPPPNTPELDFSTLPASLHTKLSLLKSSLLSIPSFHSSEPLITTLCQVWARTVQFKDVHSFMQIHICMMQLEEVCGESLEDHTRFLSVFQTAREGMRKELDEIAKEMEKVALA